MNPKNNVEVNEVEEKAFSENSSTAPIKLERKAWNAPQKTVVHLSETKGKQVQINNNEFFFFGLTWGPS